MELEEKMEYAIRLAAPEASHLWEEFFKLASLCEDIANLRENGDKADSELESRFIEAIKAFHHTNGKFRQEVERFASAKKLIDSM
ncbi:MAG: hypothetical protein HON53_17880 [Planctomycetaceae bacterium]|nr:hypothetical protein [Planctomycetaceae bacterium]MBT6493599.1 hypothetical protein [Planctomycetaceae bacterium]